MDVPDEVEDPGQVDGALVGPAGRIGDGARKFDQLAHGVRLGHGQVRVVGGSVGALAPGPSDVVPGRAVVLFELARQVGPVGGPLEQDAVAVFGALGVAQAVGEPAAAAAAILVQVEAVHQAVPGRLPEERQDTLPDLRFELLPGDPGHDLVGEVVPGVGGGPEQRQYRRRAA